MNTESAKLHLHSTRATFISKLKDEKYQQFNGSRLNNFIRVKKTAGLPTRNPCEIKEDQPKLRIFLFATKYHTSDRLTKWLGNDQLFQMK
jgi:hypothetical protein